MFLLGRYFIVVLLLSLFLQPPTSVPTGRAVAAYEPQVPAFGPMFNRTVEPEMTCQAPQQTEN